MQPLRQHEGQGQIFPGTAIPPTDTPPLGANLFQAILFFGQLLSPVSTSSLPSPLKAAPGQLLKPRCELKPSATCLLPEKLIHNKIPNANLVDLPLASFSFAPSALLGPATLGFTY